MAFQVKAAFGCHVEHRRDMTPEYWLYGHFSTTLEMTLLLLKHL